MNNLPYSVFVRHRPVRAAFLIDTGVFVPGTDRFEELVDAVFDANNKSWGGRTNPVVFFSGDSLSVEAWEQLELIDADVLRSFNQLPAALLNQLDERLQPWSIDVTNPFNPNSSARVEPYGIAIGPTPAILGTDAGSKLLMFEFAEECPRLLRRFLHRNFGSYFQWIDAQAKEIRREMWLENLLPKMNVQTYLISDLNSLAAALQDLAGPPPGSGYRPPIQFTAPSELSSVFLPGVHPAFGWNDAYELVIGNSPSDLTEHWNGVWWKRTWTKAHAHQLWLPEELAREPLLREPLKNWLRRYTGSGSSGAKSVEFSSSSLSPTELESLRKEICADGWAHRGYVLRPDVIAERKGKARELAISGKAALLSSTETAVRYSRNNEKEIFSLGKPDVLDDKTNPDGIWATDVQIEQVAPYHGAVPQQRWWLAPRLNSGGLVRSIFNAAARVNRHGLFSVRVENRSQRYSQRVNPELKIHLCSQNDVVRLLIVQPKNHPFLTDDPRYQQFKRQRTIAAVRVSDKGKYLNGLIQTFQDYWTAKAFCERQVWRHIFARLANRDAQKAASTRERIVNVLKKLLTDVPPETSQKFDHVAGRILGVVGSRLPAVALPYTEFKRELDEVAKTPAPPELTYAQGDTVICDHTVRHLTEQEMREGLDDLVAMNVLRPGVYVRCSFCGIETWYHVDDLKQEVRCGGCGHGRSIGAEREWHYALNSLAQMGAASGQLAAMQALGALASHATHSFFFSPSLELFVEGSERPWHEIDLAALVDGNFVIGEVKEGDVTKHDFEELAEIAEALQPQRAIMFLPLEKVGPNVIKWVEETHRRLLPRGTAAQLFTLPTF